MFDIMVAVYNGKSLTGALLEFAPATSINIQENQLGGLGQFTFGLNSQMNNHDMLNFQIPNRVEMYARQSSLTTSIAIGAVNLNVSHSENFAVGNSIVIFDGTNRSFANIVTVQTGSIGIDAATATSFTVGATILIKQYTGMIQQIETDAGISSAQKITCIGYFSQIQSQYIGAGNFQAYECGFVLLNTLLLYTDQLDLIIRPENFVHSQDGLDMTSGTKNALYANYSSGTSLGSFISDCIKAANGNSSGVGSSTTANYSLTIDEHNVVFFKQINETAPNKNYSLKYATNDIYNEGLFDNVISFQSHEDSSTIVNQILAIGGNFSETQVQPVRCVLNDLTSQNIYGIKASTATFPYITDLKTLTANAQTYLDNFAFPTFSYTIIISPISLLPKINDCFLINDLPDGSSLTCAVQSIIIEWNAASFGQLKATVQLQQLRPDISNVLASVNSQSYINTISNTEGQSSNLKDRFVVSGLDASTSANQFTTSSGIFQANVNLLQSAEKYYTDTHTLPPINSAQQIQLNLTVTSGSAFVSISDNNGVVKTVNVVGSFAGTDTGGQRAYGVGSYTFTYINSAETSGGTYTANIQENTTQSAWNGSFVWTSNISGNNVVYSPAINNQAIALTEFPILQNNFTIPSLGNYTIAYLYRNDNGTIFPTPELILFEGTETSSFSQFQYCPLFRTTCLAGKITGKKDLRNISGVTSAHIAALPNLNAPQFSILPSAFTYIGGGSGSYGAETTFSLTIGQLPTLAELRYYAVVSGAGNGAARSAVGNVAAAANGSYEIIWSGLSGNTVYDLYICFVGNDAGESLPLFVGTTAANALQLSRENQASGASGITPSASNVQLVATIANGSTNDIEISFTPSSNCYSSNNWLAGIVLVTCALGTGAWSVCTTIPPVSNGDYSPIWNASSKGAGQNFGFQLVDYQGNYSNVCFLLTTGQTNIEHNSNSTTVLAVTGNDGSSPHSTSGTNMVFNGDLSLYSPPTGTVSQYASAVRTDDVSYVDGQLKTPNGWSRNFENSLAGEGSIGYIDDPNLGRYLQMIDATSAGNCVFGCASDAIPVTIGQAYTFAADVYFGAIRGGRMPPEAAWYFSVLWYSIGTTDFSRNSSTMIKYDTIVAGSPYNPAFIAPVLGELTAPAQAGFCRIIFYHWTLNSTVSGPYLLAFKNVRMFASNMPHSTMSSAVQNQLSGSGTILDISNVAAGPTLPYSSHDGALRAVISSGGGLSVQPTGGVSGQLPRGNIHPSLTNAIDANSNISNIGAVAGGQLPLGNHASPVSGIVNGTTQIPYSSAPSAITNVISSGGVVNVNNASGQLPYANLDPNSIQTALNSVGTITGPGGCRFSTAATPPGNAGSVSISVTIPSIGGAAWYICSSWVIQCCNADVWVGISNCTNTASVGINNDYNYQGTIAQVTGSCGGGTVNVTYTYSGGSKPIQAGLLTISAFRYA